MSRPSIEVLMLVVAGYPPADPATLVDPFVVGITVPADSVELVAGTTFTLYSSKIESDCHEKLTVLLPAILDTLVASGPTVIFGTGSVVSSVIESDC
jgi:hypothetical protein